MQGEFALGTGVLPPPVPLAQPSEPPTKAALHSLAIVLRGVSLYLPFRRIGGPLRPPQSPMVVAPPLPCGRASSRHLATEDCYGYPQKPIEWNGLKIELIGAEIVDGEAFLQEYNIDRESIFSDSLSEKYALFHISVTKVSDMALV